MGTDIYFALLAQLILCFVQIALGPFLLIHVGFRRLDKLQNIQHTAKQVKTAGKGKKNGGRSVSKEISPPDDSLCRLFLSLIATIPHGIFALAAFCSLYIQRPYIFDFYDWIYYSIVEIFLLIFILYFMPSYLYPYLINLDDNEEDKKPKNVISFSIRKRRKHNRKKKNSKDIIVEVRNPEKSVNQRRRRRRRRRTFEFITPEGLEDPNIASSNSKTQSQNDCVARKSSSLKKRKGRRRNKKKQQKRSAHVKIDVNAGDVRLTDDEELPPLPSFVKYKMYKSPTIPRKNGIYTNRTINDEDTIEIVFSREIEDNNDT